MKVGLIGANGLVGAGIMAAFREAGHEPAPIQRENYAAMAGSSFDVLINANGNSKKYLSAKAPTEDFRLSVESVQRSLVDFSYGLYVHCSSVDVYCNHENPALNAETARIEQASISHYGMHKYLAEELVHHYAQCNLILRFGGFVGPGLKKNSIFDILHDQPLRVHLDSVYQYLPTKSAGEIILALMRKRVENEVFNVCGSGVISVREVAVLAGKEARLAEGTPNKERYEINIEKIEKVMAMPKTRDSVAAFVAGYQKLPAAFPV